mmetsp:Transcript_22598/g.53400  ORF Transcript_22598/g.53400 Transcript_22598/m.53400 type:complete len:199 (+) Transcript_22598:4686-5282(+)
MDAISATIVRPIVILVDTIITTLAFLIFIPALIFKVVTSGTRTLTKMEEFANFALGLPLGGWIVTFAVGIAAPYAGPIRANFIKVSKEESIVEMTEWSWLRNPFSSIHACALSNVAEMCATLTGLCAMQAQKGVRIIPVAINSSYLKKARGTVRATCKVELPKVSGKYEANVDITNKQQVLVCQVKVVFDVKVENKES